MAYQVLADKDSSGAARAAELDAGKSIFRAATHTEVDQVACSVGDKSCAAAHAMAIDRSARFGSASVERSLLRLQRQYGNRYVGQVLRQASSEGGSGDLDSIERSIDQARDGGHGLDQGVRMQMENSIGADFSGVRVRTDAHADTLSQALSARAFTTGKDVFFRQREYSPGTSAGRELLAHELTHIVQQNGDGSRRKMSVSEPGDAYEMEADRVAAAVMHREQQDPGSAERQLMNSEEEDKDKDKKLAAKRDSSAIQRQPESDQAEEEKKKKRLQGA